MWSKDINASVLRVPTLSIHLVYSCSKVMGFFLQMHIWSIDHQYFEASFWHDIYQVFCDHTVKFHVLIIIHDYSSRLCDHSKSVSFEKRNIKMIATGSVFGGYFNIRDKSVWEFKLFLFHGIEMKLMHKIIVCVFGSWNEMNPSLIKYSKIGNFGIPLIR